TGKRIAIAVEQRLKDSNQVKEKVKNYLHFNPVRYAYDSGTSHIIKRGASFDQHTLSLTIGSICRELLNYQKYKSSSEENKKKFAEMVATRISWRMLAKFDQASDFSCSTKEVGDPLSHYTRYTTVVANLQLPDRATIVTIIQSLESHESVAEYYSCCESG
nr:hypothetical protein [Chlamydiota bacterium]